ncbi:hypothetical protein L227DRAFT_420546 [Lentinus tigrinus ALCF2SS1-6]|uniref:Uncharacterized protein n=1 Tax=Lentinus tigrinus ALCF2SS1-6 TaxID=1328759 RepID=A0A5C2RNC8_9APHY|nr:hypothetical protein L227DRAFT_420546 [Lentinus tigrinus ALCF2SS1-6]
MLPSSMSSTGHSAAKSSEPPRHPLDLPARRAQWPIPQKLASRRSGIPLAWPASLHFSKSPTATRRRLCTIIHVPAPPAERRQGRSVSERSLRRRMMASVPLSSVIWQLQSPRLSLSECCGSSVQCPPWSVSSIMTQTPSLEMRMTCRLRVSSHRRSCHCFS